MKTFMQAIALVLLCTGLSFPTFAQQEIEPDNPVIDVNFTADLPAIPIPASAADGLTEIPQPLVLQHPTNGQCYAFRCAAGTECPDCKLYWKDRNGDGRINPRRELRCRCGENPEAKCRIKVRQIACPD
ncbi:hypothetical protein [Flavilitoribacter nigricans]|uniref:EF-hand domain-containing protein n=1 Tax=Flavilitoribacter nigricans (strain ATCC 23147 / DSM 23189 / NBRC 102662 / NCIMB 1420 / SS-2) TaxID=1122177 RepID=A0A2D0N5E7_FLAN2|nr:hypothetical protein [Flavilitoribacter nigricans]PHN03724.1 hypothetical protein CRP01_24530 [Flavilitoribacter nigricans DSM 23189 = NBRC 102662]